MQQECGAVELVIAAVSGAASEPYKSDGSRPEAALVDAVERHVDASTKREHRGDEVVGWKRQPGGVDLAVLGSRGTARTVLEMKVDKLDESLWDIFKIASLLRHAHIEAGCLVYESTHDAFDGSGDCAELFRPPGRSGSGDQTSRAVGAAELVARWPNAWAYLLAGGYGNHPVEAVERVRLTARDPIPLAHYTDREIRVLWVAPESEVVVQFDSGGWPEGVSPPARPHAGSTGRAPAPEAAEVKENPEHMELPKRITQPWLEAHVPEMSDDDFQGLLAVLRRKRWTQDELESRVHPLRPRAATAPEASVGPSEPIPTPSDLVEPPHTAPSAPAPEQSLPELIKRVLPAVVQVASIGRRRKESGTGSGFAIPSLEGDEDSTIFVTNAHVTAGGKEFGVRWGENEFYRAELMLEEGDTDISLLTIPVPARAALPVRILDDVQVGESVIAVGSPLGLTETVTEGIVSALNRRAEVFTGNVLANFIQTSAPVNPGNSGGPLIGPDGRVIGVNTWIKRGGSGLAFAVPAETALRLYVNL